MSTTQSTDDTEKNCELKTAGASSAEPAGAAPTHAPQLQAGDQPTTCKAASAGNHRLFRYPSSGGHKAGPAPLTRHLPFLP